jgi:hypothetical protein
VSEFLILLGSMKSFAFLALGASNTAFTFPVAALAGWG